MVEDSDGAASSASNSNSLNESALADDWANIAVLKKIVARQKCAERKGKFDPFAYFGALEMAEIPAEDKPADMRI